ncbi:2-dehydropantoate 2-reductase [Pseudomonas sp. LFM046]|uniref:2-dehydropantoate 2-reductase n=1 Tax=Pseudomonas sp. LFM046 TaxID=1608357 RepID=UPI000CCBD903|nr:2-dehydropantoate 2-reductase [Pseudomonas sp. LFM046]
MATVAVFGAGTIGCYVGGRLATGGVEVVFVGREHMAATLSRQGLTLSDLFGWKTKLTPSMLDFTSDPAAVAGADLVLVTVKSGDTASAADAMASHLRPSTPLLTFQNGLHNAEVLSDRLPGHPVLSGSIPFNVAQVAPGHFHQGSEGTPQVQRSPLLDPVREAFERGGLRLVEHQDFPAVQWAKLLFNLNNAVNALSGLPLRDELMQRPYRQVLAAAQREGLALLSEKHQHLARLTPLPAQWIPMLLETPDAVFRLAAKRMLDLDPLARSSMQDDLAAGRKTEIDFLQGEILDLAQRLNRQAPVNARLLQLVHTAEEGGRRNWSGDALLAQVRG